MKNRLLFLCLSAFLICGSLTAQTPANGPHIGFRAGLNIAKWTVSAEGVSIGFSPITALQLRAAYQMPTGLRTSIQIEAGYTGRGFEVGDLFGTGGDDSKLRVDYFDFNGTFKYHFPSNGSFNPFIGAGLTAAYAISGATTENGQSEPIDFDDTEISRIDVLIEPVAGFSVGQNTKFVFDLRYNIGVINLAGDADPGEGSANNRGWTFTAGVAVPL